MPPPVLWPGAQAAGRCLPALQFATTADEFAVQDLPDCLDAEGSWTLVARLVREGVLQRISADLRPRQRRRRRPPTSPETSSETKSQFFLTDRIGRIYSPTRQLRPDLISGLFCRGDASRAEKVAQGRRKGRPARGVRQHRAGPAERSPAVPRPWLHGVRHVPAGPILGACPAPRNSIAMEVARWQSDVSLRGGRSGGCILDRIGCGPRGRRRPERGGRAGHRGAGGRRRGAGASHRPARRGARAAAEWRAAGRSDGRSGPRARSGAVGGRDVRHRLGVSIAGYGEMLYENYASDKTTQFRLPAGDPVRRLPVQRQVPVQLRDRGRAREGDIRRVRLRRLPGDDNFGLRPGCC